MSESASEDATIISDDGKLVVQENLITVLRRLQHTQTEGFARLQEGMNSKADKADVASISVSLANKADKSDIDKLTTTQQKLQDSISSLESWRHDAELHKSIKLGRWNTRERVAGAVAGVAVAAGTLLAVFHPFH